jgi:phosphatidylinositol alpha-1,6-mannosyltransferase
MAGRETILVLSDVFPPRTGGSGRWLWELYRRMEGADVHVIAGDAPDADVFDRAAPMSIERIPLSFTNWGLWHLRGAGQYGKATMAVSSVVARIRPGVIHCGKCLPEGLIASWIKRWYGIPFQCFVHGEELTLAATSRELTRLTGTVLHNCSAVIANSQHSKQLLLRTWPIPEHKVQVMHPGVDTSRFTPAPSDPAVRQRLEWSNRRVVLTVGALQKRKGQDPMIRALPAIRQRIPDVLYSIAGEGWERPYLERLVAEHGVADAVQFRGIPGDDELIQCYQQCDLFALPNRQIGWDFEGFGIVLLEAQACGKPAVAGNSGGTPETLRPGETGLLVASDSPDALAEAVCNILDEPERAIAMGRAGRDWVTGRFAWTVLAREAQEVFGFHALAEV